MIGREVQKQAEPDEQHDDQRPSTPAAFRPRTAPRPTGFGVFGGLALCASLGFPSGLLDRRRRGPGPRGALRVRAWLGGAGPRNPRRTSASVVGRGLAPRRVRPLAQPSPRRRPRARSWRVGFRFTPRHRPVGPRRDRLDDLGAEHRDVARPHRDDDVALAHRGGHLLGDGGEVRQVASPRRRRGRRFWPR